MLNLLRDPSALVEHLLLVLNQRNGYEHFSTPGISPLPAASAVLLPLSMGRHDQGASPGPSLVYNKRSKRVKQAGDLCFPGGRVMPRADFYLSKILGLPLFPLARWPYWSRLRRLPGGKSRSVAVLFAASLRESLEEMRLNPLSVKFLGPLPPQRLVMFQRVIFPMVGWISGQKRFFPNWEVEKIVYIPLRDLLEVDRYACYRLDMGSCGENERGTAIRDFPCFLHRGRDGEEILWGATYRITILFLELVFGFSTPPMEDLPVVEGALNQTYLTGAGNRGRMPLAQGAK
ncbi:MAG TPA: CoA pyrophosphatase [Deltaproteobacteria bacterium]|nr:CoA pyrophosphatase [Deltaproteobacteria bacterium]HDZ89293.1 CoA pyrophosphatase [Deltaproteobacteria bacterium]